MPSQPLDPRRARRQTARRLLDPRYWKRAGKRLLEGTMSPAVEVALIRLVIRQAAPPVSPPGR